MKNKPWMTCRGCAHWCTAVIDYGCGSTNADAHKWYRENGGNERETEAETKHASALECPDWEAWTVDFGGEG